MLIDHRSVIMYQTYDFRYGRVQYDTKNAGVYHTEYEMIVVSDGFRVGNFFLYKSRQSLAP